MGRAIKVGIAATLLLLSPPVHAAQLDQVTVSAGSGPTNQIFGHPACDGNAYYLVEKTVNAYVTKTYIFVASHAPAIDLWLYTDSGKIIGEVHQVTGKHPASGLNYWESERSFGNDSMWVGKVWVLSLCYGVTTHETIEPYAIVYTRSAP